jgi:hypothetical protein
LQHVAVFVDHVLQIGGASVAADRPTAAAAEREPAGPGSTAADSEPLLAPVAWKLESSSVALHATSALQAAMAIADENSGRAQIDIGGLEGRRTRGAGRPRAPKPRPEPTMRGAFSDAEPTARVHGATAPRRRNFETGASDPG